VRTNCDTAIHPDGCNVGHMTPNGCACDCHDDSDGGPPVPVCITCTHYKGNAYSGDCRLGTITVRVRSGHVCDEHTFNALNRQALAQLDNTPEVTL